MAIQEELAKAAKATEPAESARLVPKGSEDESARRTPEGESERIKELGVGKGPVGFEDYESREGLFHRAITKRARSVR